MKKPVQLLALSLALAFSMSLFLVPCSAEDGLSDWTLSGTTATVQTDGIHFKADSLDALTYGVYNVPQNTQDVSVEITPVYCENKTDYDAWICVSFMGVPSMFSLEDQKNTPGFVALYYNYKGTFRITLDGYMEKIYNGLNSWRLLEKGTPLKVGQKNKIVLKWDTEQNFYHLVINDVQLDDNAQLMLAVKDVIFPTGSKYILVGSYTQDGKPAEFIINSINGKELGAAQPTSSAALSSAPASSAAASFVSQDSAVSNPESLTASSEVPVESTVSEEASDVSDGSASTISGDGMAGDDETDGNSALPIILGIAGGAIILAAAILLFLKRKASKGQ